MLNINLPLREANCLPPGKISVLKQTFKKSEGQCHHFVTSPICILFPFIGCCYFNRSSEEHGQAVSIMATLDFSKEMMGEQGWERVSWRHVGTQRMGRMCSLLGEQATVSRPGRGSPWARPAPAGQAAASVPRSQAGAERTLL